MKITLELPDNTMCMFIDVMTAEEDEYYAKASAFAGDDIQDGAELKVEVKTE